MEYKPILKGNIMTLPKRFKKPIRKIELGKTVNVEKNKTCLNGYYKQFSFSVKNGEGITIENYLKSVENKIIQSLQNNIGNKVILGLTVNMRQGDSVEEKYFNSYPHIVNAWNNKKNIFNSLYSQLVSVYNNTDFEGSGWGIIGNARVTLNYGKYEPFKGGCSVVDLPKWLSDKKATTSIISGDLKCFFWCILRFFNPKEKDKGRLDKNLIKISKDDPNRYADFSGVLYPVSSEDVELFQKRNPHLCILIYGVDVKAKKTPLIYDGKEYANPDATNIFLLFYFDHYYLINDLSRLLTSQIRGYHGGKLYFCHKCQRTFKNEEKLNAHILVCSDITLLQLPEPENSIIKDNPKNITPPCISIYADFECLVTPTTPEEQEKGKYQKHIPSCWCFFVKSYTDAVGSFCKYQVLKDNEDIVKNFVSVLMYTIRVSVEKYKRKTNLLPCHTPVFFHNLKGYDAHLFIIELAEYGYGGLSVLPSNEKNYISFSKFTIIDGKKHEIRFLDSLRILDASIEQLAYELPTEEMEETIKYFPDVPNDILKGKGFYPYDYMDSAEKLNVKFLPTHINFFSSLKNKNITLNEYEKARQGWKAFKCKNMSDYTRIYCIRDVLLLCDIFENFRKINLKEYDVDPLISGYTLPGISWYNMLRFTKQELKLIVDRKQYEDFEKGIRGGVSMCVTRHAKANNKYLKDYDPTKPSTYIFYVDENNLYGNSMSQNLPYEIAGKMTKPELKDWRNYTCALVVDLEIPKEKHDFLNAFPPAPEHLTINGVKKLVPNLRNKKEYIVYSELLAFYVDVLGLKITHIYRGYIFKFSKWLKSYIDNNTQKRIKAYHEKQGSKENFYKKCNNSIYGKTIENPRKRCNVELVNCVERAKKLNQSPEYLKFTIFSDNLVAVHKKKTVVNCNKPIYIGFVILELSKLKMYRTYYEYFKPKFGDRVKLLYTDTDSFILEIQSEDLYEEIADNVKDRYDTRKYPKNSPLYYEGNAFKLGCLKDETNGKPIREFCGTCAKSYSYTIEGEETENKRCKGVKDSAIEELTIEDYLNCIFEGKEKMVSFGLIHSTGHDIYTEKVEKIALTPTQDVRYVLPDQVNTLSIGHYANPTFCDRTGREGEGEILECWEESS